MEGMWQQHELWDGTYTFDDWADAVEMIAVNKKNKAVMIENVTNSVKRN